jgi:hypothetical protein
MDDHTKDSKKSPNIPVPITCHWNKNILVVDKQRPGTHIRDSGTRLLHQLYYILPMYSWRVTGLEKGVVKKE